MESEHYLFDLIQFTVRSSNIEWIRPIDPLDSSFYMAVGTGFIEAIIRFLKCPKYLNPVWTSLQKLEGDARRLAEQVG